MTSPQQRVEAQQDSVPVLCPGNRLGQAEGCKGKDLGGEREVEKGKMFKRNNKTLKLRSFFLQLKRDVFSVQRE